MTLANLRQLVLEPSAYMQPYFQDSNLKSGFQGYFYGLLMQKELTGDFQIGILGMKQLNNGVQWLQQGRTINAELITEFETGLKTMVKAIYDPAINFIQTEDEKACSYCPYNRICAKV